MLRVVSGKGARAHGQTDSLMIGDEVWSWPNATLLEAFQTALINRPDARLILISTAASTMDSPLGRQRVRAMAGEVKVTGSKIEATTEGLRWLEWSLPDGADPNDMREAKRCNPAPWITVESLREQRGAGSGAFVVAVPPLSVGGRFRCVVAAWSVGRCRDDYEVEPGEDVWLGVDIGGSRAASAVVGVTADLRVAIVEVFQGNESVLEVTSALQRLAGKFNIREVACDPWRFKSEAMRLESEGLLMVEFPQSHARMTVASEKLHSVVTEGRLRHPGDPDLDRHVAAAVARQTGRGWRLDKANHAVQIDAVIGLAMAVERAEAKVAPGRLVGWV